jgi:hypothetical protein
MAKLSKEYAQYGPAKPGGDRCDECKWFLRRLCEIVEGPIASAYWCRFHHSEARKPRDREADRGYVRAMRQAARND